MMLMLSELFLPNSHPRNAPQDLRRTIVSAGVQTLSRIGSFARTRNTLASSGGVVVLTLHRIVPDLELSSCRSPQGMVLRESLFCKLIDYLKENTEVISPDELPSRRRSKRPRVAITFDDGWIDNLEIAAPYLAQTQMAATFFMASGLAGREQPFWPEQVIGLMKTTVAAGRVDLFVEMLRSLGQRGSADTPPAPFPSRMEPVLTWLKRFPASTIRFAVSQTLCELARESRAFHTHFPSDPRERLMTWEQLRRLIEQGHQIGSHASTHELLPLLSRPAIFDELKSSRDLIHEQLPSSRDKPLWLSYPGGYYNDDVKSAATEAGYRIAFVNSVGVCHEHSDPLLLPRINVWDGTLINAHGEFCERRLEYSLFWRPTHARAIV